MMESLPTLRADQKLSPKEKEAKRRYQYVIEHSSGTAGNPSDLDFFLQLFGMSVDRDISH